MAEGLKTKTSTDRAAKKKELWKEISKLTGSQARIALCGILDGKKLTKAIEIAKTFPD